MKGCTADVAVLARACTALSLAFRILCRDSSVTPHAAFCRILLEPGNPLLADAGGTGNGGGRYAPVWDLRRAARWRLCAGPYRKRQAHTRKTGMRHAIDSTCDCRTGTGQGSLERRGSRL